VWIDHRLLQAKNRQPFLTKKEKQVIHYIAKGMTSKQVAEKMNLSSRTVETHRYNILNKMNVKSVVELIKLLSDQKISY
jgi:DNA-binding NarL/FixJ family response regulator